MNLSTFSARVLAALVQPRLGMAVVFSVAVTAGVAGPMAYQASHYQVPSRADAPTTAPAPPSSPHRPTTATSTTSTSTTTTAPTTSTTPTTTGARGTGTGRPRPTSPDTDSPPSSSTPTTTGPVTTTGAPVRLHTQIGAAGSLVTSHRGAVAVQVAADGGSSGQVRLTITATGATPMPAPNDGWTCGGVGTVVCNDQGGLGPSSPETVFVALDVPATATTVAITAAATAPGASSSPDATATDRTATSGGFSARFAGIVRGDAATIGNTLSTCPSGATAGGSTCEQARARAASVATGQDNNDWPMVSVDADNDPSTANSSAANLVTAGSDVVSANLYWSAAQAAGAGGSAASGPIGSALLATPATTGNAGPTAASYVGVTADHIDQVGTTYQAHADVTDLVRSGGAGRYWLGGVAAATGNNTQSGWSLSVVYRRAGAAPRTILIFDGLVQVADGSESLVASGFRVASGTSAQLGIVGYEGDWGLRTDAVTCGTSSPLSDATRAPDNFFNSSITRAGAVDASGTPSQANTFGLDIASIDVSPAQVAGCLTPGSSSTSLQFSTSDDQYLVGVVTVSASR
jgi:hypothetical protein